MKIITRCRNNKTINSKMDLDKALALRDDCLNGKCPLDSEEVNDVLFELVGEKNQTELLSSYLCFFIGMLNESEFIKKMNKMIDDDCNDINEVYDAIVLSSLMCLGDDEIRIANWLIPKYVELKGLDIAVPFFESKDEMDKWQDSFDNTEEKFEFQEPSKTLKKFYDMCERRKKYFEEENERLEKELREWRCAGISAFLNDDKN